MHCLQYLCHIFFFIWIKYKKTMGDAMKRMLCVFLSSILFCSSVFSHRVAYAKEEAPKMDLTSASYVLMEGSTGKIICEKDKDKQLMPASITKIMTLILIFEALDQKKISLKDKVTVSEHAASMGGSQVYLEPNETQTVDDMIKCITIASANDACVAMAEHIAGTEEAFVEKMNEKAKKLGMKHSHFMNCCGLDDALTEGQHYSSAYDIALMSRELITKHKEVTKYTTVWMDTITHVTKKGESEFGLTNTNKLVRFYQGITGLKTGSTSKAKFCLSATAKRNGMDLIAVVMAAPEPKTRFSEAASLLDYGFANCSIYKDNHKKMEVKSVAVKRGKKDQVAVRPKKTFSYVCLNQEKKELISKKIQWNENIEAPIKKGDALGKIIYYYEDKVIGKIPICAQEQMERANYGDYYKKVLKEFFVLGK